ncbi:response regulator [Halorientalis litorea]|uniref:response regulator n=1 Tax=Halorientalis litorea TaxID=2931977 RepID=UPI001FF5FB39|nr:response regulator [Halorientalis litorea]
MRSTVSDTGISVERLQSATEVFSYKWYPVILYSVYEVGNASYSEIEASLGGISPKMLSDGLSDLCDRNLLRTTEAVENSGKEGYELTEKGRAIVPALDLLTAWHERYDERRASVLIVEDERMVASVLSEYFDESYGVRHARTGEQALEKCSDSTDLVVLDRRLDEMSGDDVATQLRAQYEQLVVLVVSGIAPDDDIATLDIDDYLHKPVEEDGIKARLESLLSRTDMDSAARTYLALRSKQLALTETHGEAAQKMQGYQDCASRIEELDLSPEQKQTLEPLLPPAASEVHSRQ